MANDTDLVVVLQTSKGFVALSSTDIQKFYFTEDIFSWFIMGSLIYHDRDGFIESVGLTGYEKMIVMYGNEPQREIAFDIYKIKKLMPSDTGVGKTTIFEIVFVDTTYSFLVERTFSRGWAESSKISTIVEETLNYAYIKKTPPDNSYLKINRWENTENTIDNFYIPYWSPMKAIRYLNQKGKGSITDSFGYVCYNSTYEGVGGMCANWLTLEGLFGNYKNTDLKTYVDPKTYLFQVPENLLYKNKILDWRREKSDSQDIRSLSGGRRIGFNFDSKRFIDRTYKYSDTVTKFSLMGSYSLFPAIDSHDSNIKISSGETADEVDNEYYYNWINRYSKQHVIGIMVYGAQERYAGMQIDVKWDSSATGDDYDKGLVGKYLVGSISHIFGSFGTTGYMQKMILFKNAYHNTENPSLIKAGEGKVNNDLPQYEVFYP